MMRMMMMMVMMMMVMIVVPVDSHLEHTSKEFRARVAAAKLMNILWAKVTGTVRDSWLRFFDDFFPKDKVLYTSYKWEWGYYSMNVVTYRLIVAMSLQNCMFSSYSGYVLMVGNLTEILSMSLCQRAIRNF